MTQAGPAESKRLISKPFLWVGVRGGSGQGKEPLFLLVRLRRQMSTCSSRRLTGHHAGTGCLGKAPFQRQQVQGQAPATSLGSLQPVAEEATPVLSGYRIPLKPFELAFCRLPPEKVQMNGTI